ncbi:MAG: hypothetical protein ACI9D5_002133 [Candidatus Endobugula sp.]|jgi:hypothetical protein
MFTKNHFYKKIIGAFLLLSVLLSVLALSFSTVVAEKAGDGAMDNEKIDVLIKRFDTEAKARPGFWQLTHEDMEIYVITDEPANRMRIIVEIADTAQLEKQHLHRLMQANFDSALDARYAIAQESLWSAYIHPLSSLSEHDFFSGLAQVITLAKTFGSSFSSGALFFGGGDSQTEQENLYQALLKKGLSV